MRARLPTLFILITVVIDAMGIGIIIPVMPALILDIEGGTLANAAIWGGILSSSFAVMQFLCGPLLGNLSDRYGRRPVLLVSLFVMSIDYVIMALTHSIWVLLFARIIGGITGATQATAAAFMADTNPPEKRGAGFGMVSAALGLGFVLGPVIGGLLGDLGPRAPFYAAACLAGANFIFGLIVLPETVTPEKRRTFSLARANPFGALRQIRSLPGLGRLLSVLLLYQLAFNAYPAIWAYYTQARFDWDTRMIGISLAVFGISMALVQGVLIRFTLRSLGETGTVMMGFGFAIFSFACLGVLTSGWMALLLTPISAMAAMSVPALQSIMSRQSGEDAQGEMQGIFSSTGALAMILSPLLMTQVFAAFTSTTAPVYLPGAPFLASLCLALAGLTLFLRHKAQS